MTKQETGTAAAILTLVASLAIFALAIGGAIIADYGAGVVITATLGWAIPSVLIITAALAGIIAGEHGAETIGEWLAIAGLTFAAVGCAMGLAILTLASAGLPIPAPFGIFADIGIFAAAEGEGILAAGAAVAAPKLTLRRANDLFAARIDTLRSMALDSRRTFSPADFARIAPAYYRLIRGEHLSLDEWRIVWADSYSGLLDNGRILYSAAKLVTETQCFNRRMFGTATDKRIAAEIAAAFAASH